ncbi:MAG TPA: hypothetical protein VLF67_05310 [Candidatus Saccharimonas sp.]|nr:hypothetical protein [Candidatus Saccharimonas sp.]
MVSLLEVFDKTTPEYWQARSLVERTGEAFRLPAQQQAAARSAVLADMRLSSPIVRDLFVDMLEVVVAMTLAAVTIRTILLVDALSADLEPLI